MSITVNTIAPTLALTSPARVALHLPGADTDTLVPFLIDAASAAIVSYCNRPFAREAVSELLPGYGDIYMQLARTPIVRVLTVMLDSDLLTDWSIYDRNEGTIYRRAGWGWTAQRDWGLSGRQRWPGMGFPVPGADEPRFGFQYEGGFLLPSQNRAGGTVSVLAADQSFNDSANGFPSLLRAGDVVTSAGFAENNSGRFVVTGTPTPGKVTVQATTLTNEAAAAGKSLSVGDLPADVEKACIEAVRAWKLSATKDPSVIERQLGPARERMSESDLVGQLPLPGVCVGLLSKWRRAA